MKKYPLFYQLNSVISMYDSYISSYKLILIFKFYCCFFSTYAEYYVSCPNFGANFSIFDGASPWDQGLHKGHATCPNYIVIPYENLTIYQIWEFWTCFVSFYCDQRTKYKSQQAYNSWNPSCAFLKQSLIWWQLEFFKLCSGLLLACPSSL